MPEHTSTAGRDLGLDDPSLPQATAKACRECPWRREPAAGYLGPLDADEWLVTPHSDAHIACHIPLPCDDPPSARSCNRLRGSPWRKDGS